MFVLGSVIRTLAMSIAFAILLRCISRRGFRLLSLFCIAISCLYLFIFVNFTGYEYIENKFCECIGTPRCLYDMAMDVYETTPDVFQAWAQKNAEPCLQESNDTLTVQYLCCGKLSDLSEIGMDIHSLTDMEQHQNYILVLEKTNDGFVPFGAVTSMSKLDTSDYQPEKVEALPQYHFPNWPLYLYQWHCYTFEYYAYDF